MFIEYNPCFDRNCKIFRTSHSTVCIEFKDRKTDGLELDFIIN